jgi:hypothetical protein
MQECRGARSEMEEPCWSLGLDELRVYTGEEHPSCGLQGMLGLQ